MHGLLRQKALKGLLQAVEHLLDTSDGLRLIAKQLLNAEPSGKPLSPQTLKHYDEQLELQSQHGARMRELVSQWWTMIEDSGLSGQMPADPGHLNDVGMATAS